MDREEFLRLISPEAQALLADLSYDSKADVVALVSSLRKQGHDPAVVATVLTQAKLRKRATAKFGEFASQLLFTEHGLEQATRLKVAALHAGRFQRAGISEVADLGCGIGSESMALASLGIKVHAFEIDEVTAALATYNLAAFENCVVKQADVEGLDLNNFESLFFDPARRDLTGPKGISTTRHFDPAHYSPNFDFCTKWAELKPTGIKLGPGHDKKAIPETAEAQWVSVNGDLVELGLWFGSLGRPGISRSALLLSDSGVLEITSAERTSESAALGDVKDFVFEPDASLIRSGLMSDFAADENLEIISPDIAYLTSSQEIKSPWLKTYAVMDNLPFDRKKLKAYLKERKVGVLEIKKRGSDISPEKLRQELALKGENTLTLIITRVRGDHRVLVTKPISS
jgi:hypothetical protein